MIGAGNGKPHALLSRSPCLSSTAHKPSSPRTDGQFAKLSARLNLPTLPSDPLFATNSARVANRSALLAHLNAALSAHPTAHWLALFKGCGFPHAPVNDIAGTFAHAQVEARGQVVEVDHPRCGTLKVVGPAVLYGGERMKVSRGMRERL